MTAYRTGPTGLTPFVIPKNWKQDYRRIAGPLYDPQGVIWWFVGTGADGVTFARGGRVRTCRAAREQIRHALYEFQYDQMLIASRPTHLLDAKTGALITL